MISYLSFFKEYTYVITCNLLSYNYRNSYRTKNNAARMLSIENTVCALRSAPALSWFPLVWQLGSGTGFTEFRSSGDVMLTQKVLKFWTTVALGIEKNIYISCVKNKHGRGIEMSFLKQQIKTNRKLMWPKSCPGVQ